MLEKREFDKSDFLWRLSTTITIVSGLFSVLVFILIIVNYWQIKRLDPVDHPLLTELRQEYANAPEKDEVLAQRIRDLDLMTRKAFFTSQTHLRMGAWILLGSVSIFLIAFKNMIRWRPQLPELADVPTADKEFLAYAQSRHLITWAGIGLLAGGMMISYFTESALTAELLEAGKAADSGDGGEGGGEATAAAEAVPAPTWDEMLVNWPSFRGPGANGVAHFTNAPTAWNFEDGTNIRWQVEMPLIGNNSPVIWGNRLYVSGADAEKREVACYDTETGEQVWLKTVERFPNTPREPIDVMEDTGHAAPSMVAHGGLVFVLYANGDFAAYDAEGNQRWGKNLGLTENHYGHSSSLLAYGDLVYVQYDDSADPKLLAFDMNTGEQAWKTAREEISWASPILARTSLGEHVVLASETLVNGYNPETGDLIWSVACLGGEVSPSPAYANGIIFAANEYAVCAAISLEEAEDGVKASVAWEYDYLMPEVSSPVGDGERFYFGTAIGDIVCLDAKTGEEVWVQETEDGFYSSPVLVGERVYIADLSGNMYIFETANEYKEIARIDLGEPAFATPAFMDGRIYIRTPENLYCVEAS